MKYNKESGDFFKWFREYVSSFYCDNEVINRNIKIKEGHTLRVVQNVRELLRSNNINEEISELSVLIALFHDIGRFEQYKKYGTFNDKVSTDHAKLGVHVLRENSVLSSLSERKIHLITNTILFHNKKDLYSKSKDQDLILLSKLIRDSDKLDILKILTESFLDPDRYVNPALSLDLPEKNEFSRYSVKEFFNNKPLDNKKIENQADFKLLLISWIYDLNFYQTLIMIIEKKYIKSLFSVLPQNDLLEKMKTHTFDFIKKKLHLHQTGSRELYGNFDLL
ncbi:MAG: HD domain-containing protein [Acidobacteriota bacterium]